MLIFVFMLIPARLALDHVSQSELNLRRHEKHNLTA